MTTDRALAAITGLREGIDDHGTKRGGSAGRYYYYRPHEILVAEEDLEPVEGILGPGRRLAFAATARGMQRRAKRDRNAPFGIRVFGLDPDADVENVLAVLREHGITCDFNYVTAPTPMRSHASFYPEPASVAAVLRPPVAAAGAPAVKVGVLDTGRPYYDPSFIEYYRNQFAPGADGEAPSPLTVLDHRFESGDGHDDQDTMVTSFGRLARPYAGHGLFVASIIARYAPAAILHAETTLSGESIGDLYDVLVDLENAAEAGCRVINMSLGFDAREGADGISTCPPLLDRALRHLADTDNVKLVASAGNDGTDRRTWPAAHPTVAAIGALGVDGQPTDWSNFGPWVDACAMATDVVSDYVYADLDNADGSGRRFTGAAKWSGTSFAAPRVAALLATEYSAALASSPQGQQPLVEDVWRELVGKAWIEQTGGEPDAVARREHPYGPRLA